MGGEQESFFPRSSVFADNVGSESFDAFVYEEPTVWSNNPSAEMRHCQLSGVPT